MPQRLPIRDDWKSVISVVIPNLNGEVTLPRCLEGLKRQVLIPDEVIVVDNGSSDRSIPLIQEHLPKAKVIPLGSNTGFAHACNVGIDQARGDLVALLNNDAYPEPDWLSEMARTFQDGSVGACTPKMLQMDGRIDSAGNAFSRWGVPFPRGRSEFGLDQCEAVFAFSGGACLLRKAALQRAGLFDEDFFAYYEDVDLSFRIRFAGYQILYQPKAVVFHEVGASSGGGYNRFTRFQEGKNSILLYVKNMPRVWIHLPRFLLIQLLTFAHSISIGLAGPHIRGILTGIRLIPTALRTRKRTRPSPLILQIMDQEPPPAYVSFFKLGKRSSAQIR